MLGTERCSSIGIFPLPIYSYNHNRVFEMVIFPLLSELFKLLEKTEFNDYFFRTKVAERTVDI